MSTLFYVLLILAPAAILATAYAIIKKKEIRAEALNALLR